MRSRFIVFVLVGALALAACDSEETPDGSIGRSPRPRNGEPGQPPLKIGLVGTMTGVEGWRGEDAFEGADLGVHILNRGVPEGERRYELEVLDDGGDAAQSLELLKDLLGRGDAAGIVFAGPPEVLVDAEDLLKRAGVPAILVYGDLYGAQQLSPGSHVFQAAPPFSWQSRDIARYLARDRGYEKVGILSEAATLDGSLATRAAQGSLDTYGIDRVVQVAYQADVADALDRLEERQVEAIIVQGTPAALERIQTEIKARGARYRNSRAARVASLKKKMRKKRERKGWWHPQLLGFDLMINDRMRPAPPGTLATATYARGVHYLPIPSFERFRGAFHDWWDSMPRGYELRAYEATLAIGWAAEQAGNGDVARALETLQGKRFGGLPVTLGPDDHVLPEEVTIGLWTVPYPGDSVREETPEEVPWVPLARGFSIDGETTDILTGDWRWLFKNAPPPGGPAPKFMKMKFGVITPSSDPLR